jgi:octaprenyl-diphosphate synthase
MRNSAPELSEKIRLAIEQGGIEHLPLVIDAVNQSGALIHVKKLAELEAEKCRAAIAHFPDSEFKHAMIALTEFAVTRSF